MILLFVTAIVAALLVQGLVIRFRHTRLPVYREQKLRMSSQTLLAVHAPAQKKNA